MDNQKERRHQILMAMTPLIVSVLILGICLLALALDQNSQETSLQAGKNSKFTQELKEAKAKLQMGLNTWNPETLKAARDLFLKLLLKGSGNQAYLSYYIALTDYRLATFYLSSNNKEEAERFITEGQRYLEKTMEAEPTFGESFALYAYLLGYEIALSPEKGMTLGFKIFEYFAKASEIDPDNPRINLLQGISLLYTPEEYGGGADKSIEFLRKSVSLFEKENIQDPLKPSWGREEAYTFLGSAYKQKKEYEKARELLKKALEINPDFGLAKRELSAIEKEAKVK